MPEGRVEELDDYTGVEGLIRYAIRCRIAGGHPIFRTRFGGVFRDWVMAVCFGAADKVPVVDIVDVPPDLVEELRRYSGDWRYLRRRYRDLYEEEARKELAKLGLSEEEIEDIVKRGLI